MTRFISTPTDQEGRWDIKDYTTGQVVAEGLTAWDARTVQHALNAAVPLDDLQDALHTAINAWQEDDTPETRDELHDAISNLRRAHNHQHDSVLEKWPGITRPIPKAGSA